MAEWEAREEAASAEAAEEEHRDEALTEDELNEMIEMLCNSKAEELALLGYEGITGKEVWDCVSSRYRQLPPLHRIVNDILSLKATDLMNWITLSAWKQAESGQTN